jgi:hypothetical protein
MALDDDTSSSTTTKRKIQTLKNKTNHPAWAKGGSGNIQPLKSWFHIGWMSSSSFKLAVIMSLTDLTRSTRKPSRDKTFGRCDEPLRGLSWTTAKYDKCSSGNPARERVLLPSIVVVLGWNYRGVQVGNSCSFCGDRSMG